MLFLSVALVFFLWFLLTAAWQFQRVRTHWTVVGYINTLKVLPVWTFFSPNPGVFDSHVFYRDRLAGGAFTGWRECVLISKRQGYHLIWNPEKRMIKLVVDAMAELKEIHRHWQDKAGDPDDALACIKVSQSYLVLLNLTVGFPKLDTTSIGRQFLITDVYHGSKDRQLLPVFCSAVHEL